MPPRNKTLPADFTLVYDPYGKAELRDAQGYTVWASDEDDDFAEAVTDDFLSDDEHTDKILEYLTDGEIISDDDEIDVEEEFLEEGDGDDD